MKAVVEQIVSALSRPGSVIVIGTDTVYGLVARAVDNDAVNRLYSLKNRRAKPGTLLAANIDQLVQLGLKRRYLRAVEQFWPGAVSVVIPAGNPALFYLTQGLPDLAVRIPDNQFVLSILRSSGPLMSSSANLPGEKPAETIQQAYDYFGNRVDAYFDAGNLAGRAPSTVIRVVDDAIEVLRQGGVVIDDR